MANKYSDISIEQLACLARDAGVSVIEELPEPVIKALEYGRRSSDYDATNTFSLSKRVPNVFNQFINSLRF